jgi:hypothetical protein
MLSIAELPGAKINHRYRVYQKTLYDSELRVLAPAFDGLRT